MDQTTALSNAIQYLKHLQDRVKTLEDQIPRSNQLVEDEEEGTCPGSGSGSDNLDHGDDLAEIEVKVTGKSVLLRIRCQQRKGVLVKLLSEVEKLNLSVVTSNVSPFGSSSLNVTIVAEMEEEFCSRVEDVVETLRLALRQGIV